MLKILKDTDELAAAGRLEEVKDVPYQPDEETEAAKDDVFPLWALPEVARGFVEECTRLHQAQDLAALSVLTIAGNMAGRGLRLETWQGMQTSPNLFVIAAADSGTGKSRTLSEVMRPIRELEHKQVAEWRQHVEPKLKAELRILKDTLKRPKKNPDLEAQKELEDSEKRLKEIEKALHTPTLIVGDVTAEALGAMLEHNGETLLSASTECARIFQELQGGYSKGQVPRDDLWNAAYSLERCTVHRVTREPNVLEEPCLSVCWLPQPDKLNTLLSCETLISGGLLARCLLVKCDLPPKRDRLGEGMKQTVKDSWELLLSDLESYRNADPPCVVKPDTAAVKVLLDYQHAIADRQEIDLKDCRPFAARWCENACRISLVLHALDCGSNAHTAPFSKETAEAGIAIMKWASAQTLKVLSSRRERQRREDKDRLEEILTTAGGERTLNDLKRRNGLSKDIVKSVVADNPKIFKIVKEGSRRPSERVLLVAPLTR